MKITKTYSAKPTEVNRQWYLIDAAGVPLGRLSTVVATYLMGKHKPTYTAHIDMGDGIVVINAAKVKLTGKKLTDKIYYRHSGVPGNLKSQTAGELLAKSPEKLIQRSVRGMLPVNKLRAARLAKLKVYAGAEHDQEAQQPLPLEIK